MFELDQLYGGYVVRQKISENKYRYVTSCRNGIYRFSLDYLYAKRYTPATARKHCDILNERS